MTRSRWLVAVRWLVVYSFLGCSLFTSSGCFSLIIGQADYFYRKEQIRNTHAAITVRGQVVDDAGHKFPFQKNGYGIVTITGVRDSLRFNLESDRGSTELVCDADWFGYEFLVHIDNVREATLVFTHEGYRPAVLRVPVQPGTKNGPAQPVVINDAVIVMHPDDAER